LCGDFRTRREEAAGPVAVDGVEQPTRYLELLNRDPLLAPVRGVDNVEDRLF